MLPKLQLLQNNIVKSFRLSGFSFPNGFPEQNNLLSFLFPKKSKYLILLLRQSNSLRFIHFLVSIFVSLFPLHEIIDILEFSPITSPLSLNLQSLHVTYSSFLFLLKSMLVNLALLNLKILSSVFF